MRILILPDCRTKLGEHKWGIKCTFVLQIAHEQIYSDHEHTQTLVGELEIVSSLSELRVFGIWFLDFFGSGNLCSVTYPVGHTA